MRFSDHIGIGTGIKGQGQRSTAWWFQTPGGPLELPVRVNFNPPPDTQISSA